VTRRRPDAPPGRHPPKKLLSLARKRKRGERDYSFPPGRKASSIRRASGRATSLVEGNTNRQEEEGEKHEGKAGLSRSLQKGAQAFRKGKKKRGGRGGGPIVAEEPSCVFLLSLKGGGEVPVSPQKRERD